MSVADRFKLVQRKKACLNCLSSDHRASECPSKFTCKECKGKHHTLVHKDCQPDPKKECKEDQEQKTDNAGSYMVSTHCSGGTPTTSVLLVIAVLKIRNSAVSEVCLRGLPDSESQASFITEVMSKALMLDMQKCRAMISTLGTGQHQKKKGLHNTALNDSFKVNLHMIPRINQVKAF